MKKLLSLCVAVCLIAACTVSGAACAGKVTDEKYFVFTLCADGAGYTVSAADTDMPKTVIVPEEYSGLPVVAVSENGFSGKNCYVIREVVFKAKDIAVENSAFRGLQNLGYIGFTGAENVRIAPFAFAGCGRLNKLEVKSGANLEICEFAFKAAGFTSLEITAAATVRDYAFSDCASLSSLKLHGAVSFSEKAVYNCASLKEVKIVID